ncbi:Metallopeptidase [Candidatus Glomeribacter gigasporarum BEG34]|uniref:Metallopeptidase n=2 Tax=Candidatus Glomeribacter gigasporarum TaxID=132144 RepID=G2JBR1_9BURK|nr:Metallopeptidase [Candidatus Glomeribacter gigasporarum BEG34]
MNRRKKMSARIRVIAVACSATFLLAACSEKPNQSNQSEPSFKENWLKKSEIDPDRRIACTDLNQYVNAKWLSNNPIPADKTQWGPFEILKEKSLNDQRAIAEAAAKNIGSAKASSPEQLVGLFYAAGMDEAAIERAGFDPVKPELDAIAALRDTSSIVRYLTDTFVRYSTSTNSDSADTFFQGKRRLFNLQRDTDLKNPKVQIAYVFQDGLGLPAPDYYTKAEHAELRSAYTAHIARLLQLVNIDVQSAQRQAGQVLAFETRLANASFTPVEMYDPDNLYHFVSVSQANQITPNFDWGAFFKAQGVDLKEGFSLSSPKFFKEVNQMLVDTSIEQWQAYLRFHALKNAAPYLSSAFQNEYFAFYDKTLKGQQEIAPRWKRVLDTVNSQLGMALGQLYVAKHFPPEAKKQALTLINNLSAALKARIEKLDWMSAETKKRALEKWQTFLSQIGYPDQWRDYSALRLKAGDYFGSIQAAARFNHAYAMSRIGQPTDRSEWGPWTTPQMINAFYSPNDNTINFPAAVLQPPYFHPQADDALNYGGIGAIIGHEMTHAYDDQGSQFDAYGKLENWWTEADRKAFKARTDTLVKQFDAYSPLPGLFVNGTLTLDENIADLGGLSISYDALQNELNKRPALAKLKIDDYTQNQRFFINSALKWRENIRPEKLKVALNTDQHAPAQYRAIGAPSNLSSFAEAFSCKAGDPMVRTGDAQVKIW